MSTLSKRSAAWVRVRVRVRVRDVGQVGVRVVGEHALKAQRRLAG